MLDDNSDLVASTSEILRDRLYLVAFKKNHKPKNTTQLHYFSIDEDFVYENFYNDFGPLNICMLYRYSQKLSTKLTAKWHAGKKIIHYTSMNSAKRLNAAYLIGSYAIIYLHKTPDEVYRRLTSGETPVYTRFCDASYGPSNFKISLIDCLNAIYKALRAGFFNFNDFDAKEYEFYERVENGDFNWIVPQKFIAFCGPHQLSKTLPNGYPCHSPQTYFEYFRANNVTTVIRLNAKVYHASSFENAGFDHKDLFFVDGSTPSDQILKKFLAICETTKGAIAVHCKAGLGRTGSLIGAYIMKHYNFSALEAIAWLRLCRPGSVIGHQQQWMEDKQAWLWSEGERLRDRCNVSTPVHVYGIYSVALKLKINEDIANDNPELLPPMVKGISQRVDTMHLNDGEESLDPIVNMQPQSRLERQNSRGSSNRKTRARSLAAGQRKESVNVQYTNVSAGGGLSSLSTSGGSDYEDVVDGDSSHTRRRKSPNINAAANNMVDSNGGNIMIAPSLRKSSAVDHQGNNVGRLTTEPLYSEKKLKKPSIVVETNAIGSASSNMSPTNITTTTTTTHNKHTIASTVKMTQAAIERQNALTQGDKLNQIKAMRRHHNSRAVLPNAVAADVENPVRHTRARSQQPFRNNNNNIVNMLTTTSPLKHSITTNNSSNLSDCTNDMGRPVNNNNAINTSDQLNNNVTTTSIATTTTSSNNNNNFTSAITTRARSLAIYSKRMGLMHLRKDDAPQQQKGPEAFVSTGHHHNVTTPTLSSLNKQSKMYNNTLLSSTTNTYNDSKIPVVRATAALIDLGATVCRMASVPDASATIPPTRSRAASHHYTLRGRSRIRYHNRTMLAGTTATNNCTSPLACVVSPSGRNSCRELTALPAATNGISTRSSAVASAALDLNSNQLAEQSSSLGAVEKKAHHSHHNHREAIAHSELNNNFDSSAIPSPPASMTCAFEMATTTMPTAAATNGLSSTQAFRAMPSTNTTTTTGIPVHQHHHHSNSYSVAQQSAASSSSSATTTTTTVAATATTTPTTSTASSMKRNKRSLSNARIEKEKCDEYNTKLLRKTRTTTTTAAATGANSNGMTLGTGNSSSSTGGGGGGSFKGRRQIPTASASAAATTNSSSTGALLVLEAASTTTTAQKDQQERAEQQQRLLLKLRKKVSY